LSLVALETVVAFTPLFLLAQTPSDKKADVVVVADGTPVHLVLMDDLQGKKLQVKQTVRFEVRENVIVQSRLIVRIGSDAIGHIESVSRSGLFGKSGKLVLQFDSVESVAGVRIPLRGAAAVNGGKGGALTWESAMWYGPNANLPVGTVINAFVDKDQRISVP